MIFFPSWQKNCEKLSQYFSLSEVENCTFWGLPPLLFLSPPPSLLIFRRIFTYAVWGELHPQSFFWLLLEWRPRIIYRKPVWHRLNYLFIHLNPILVLLLERPVGAILAPAFILQCKSMTLKKSKVSIIIFLLLKSSKYFFLIQFV